MVGQGVHALFECANVVCQRTVPRVASMEFVSALTAKTHLHVVGHVLEQRMEEHHRHVGIFAVPGKFWQALFESSGLEQVLMVHQVVVRGDHFCRFPIRVVLAFRHGPTLRNGLFSSLRSLMCHGSDHARIKASREDDADGHIGHQSLLHPRHKTFQQVGCVG